MPACWSEKWWGSRRNELVTRLCTHKPEEHVRCRCCFFLVDVCSRLGVVLRCSEQLHQWVGVLHVFLSRSWSTYGDLWHCLRGCGEQPRSHPSALTCFWLGGLLSELDPTRTHVQALLVSVLIYPSPLIGTLHLIHAPNSKNNYAIGKLKEKADNSPVLACRSSAAVNCYSCLAEQWQSTPADCLSFEVLKSRSDAFLKDVRAINT